MPRPRLRAMPAWTGLPGRVPFGHVVRSWIGPAALLAAAVSPPRLAVAAPDPLAPCPQDLPGGDRGTDAPGLPCCLGCPLSGTYVGYRDDYDPSVPEPGCVSGPAAGPDLVFRLELERGDLFTASLIAPEIDAVLYIVRDCARARETCVAGSDLSGPGGLEHIEVGPILDPGVHFLVLDAHEPDARGTWTLLWHHDCRGQATGACCFGSHCEILESPACAAQGAEWIGPGVPCEPNPCEPLPLEPSGWGKIKPTYRR